MIPASPTLISTYRAHGTSTSGRSTVDAQAFAKIAKEAPSGYAATARLAEADALLADGDGETGGE